MMIIPSDYSNTKVVLTTNEWVENIGNEAWGNATTLRKGWMIDDDSKETMKFNYFNDNTEWNFFGFKIDQITLTDVGRNIGTNTEYSMINVKFAFKRNHPYYTITLIVPIIVLTILSPVGLILPGFVFIKS